MAGRWCGPWWCTWGFPDSKFVFGKGNYPADEEDQGICGHHVCVSERGEDDSSDQGSLLSCTYSAVLTTPGRPGCSWHCWRFTPALVLCKSVANTAGPVGEHPLPTGESSTELCQRALK